MAGDGVDIDAWQVLSAEERRKWAGSVARDMVTVDRDAKTIIVSGWCPNCGHAFEGKPSDGAIHEEPHSLYRGQPGGRIADSRRMEQFDWAGTLLFEAVCSCEEPHPQRPAGVQRGCGASGWLEDVPEE